MMAVRSRLPLIGLFVAFAFAGLLSLPTFAATATNQSITMQPATTSLSINPGATADGTYTIVNSGDSNYDVTTSVSPYHVTGEDYDPNFTQLPGTTDVASWVKLSSSSVSITARAVKQLNYTVTVPASTAPGGYYAVVFAQTTQVQTGGSGIVSHNRVGNILYITVNGNVKTGGTVTAQSVSPLLINTQIPLGVVVTNTGGLHFQTDAQFTVKSMGGKTLYHNETQRFVLPNTKRLISSNYTPSNPIGIYQISRSATAPGLKDSVATQWVFYIAPWLMDVVAIAIGVIGVAIIIRLYSRRNRTSKGLR